MGGGFRNDELILPIIVVGGCLVLCCLAWTIRQWFFKLDDITNQLQRELNFLRPKHARSLADDEEALMTSESRRASGQSMLFDKNRMVGSARLWAG